MNNLRKKRQKKRRVRAKKGAGQRRNATNGVEIHRGPRNEHQGKSGNTGATDGSLVPQGEGACGLGLTRRGGQGGGDKKQNVECTR